MYKIAITGKANSGKNTISKLLMEEIHKFEFNNSYTLAFADPIKEMIRLAYPDIPRKWLYGPSKFRNEVIPGAFKNGVPLTIRQCLIDIGNDFGRANKPDIWLFNFDIRFAKIMNRNPGLVIVTDCRFRNEFEHLKNLGFYQIRLLRDSYSKINDVSETNQDGILDNEFDFVINNNGTIKNLKIEVEKIVNQLKS